MDASRASPAGGGSSHPPSQPQPPALLLPKPEPVPEEVYQALNAPAGKRFIISVDFGTTYSAVSYVALREGEGGGYLPLDRIRSIRNYPDNFTIPGDHMLAEVPTEIFYPLNKHFRREEEALGSARENGRGSGSDEDEDDGENPRCEASAGYTHDDGYGSGEGDGTEYYDADEIMLDAEKPSSFQWGYGVHNIWYNPGTHSTERHVALSRFKLLLDQGDTTRALRDQLEPALQTLRRRDLRIINGPVDIVADFLTCLLRHTKEELRREGLVELESDHESGFRTEIVLCVPAIWTQRACRAMQTAMATALKRVHFAGADIQSNSIPNLFIVSEPEAAAAYVLAQERDVTLGETFVLLDAGGGTVDANTYTIGATTPLRLSREVVEPGGGLYGSSFLNEGFRNLLKDILAEEDYLFQDGQTLDAVVEHLLISHFEYRLKRTFNFYERRHGYVHIPALGLRDNPRKGIYGQSIRIAVQQLKNIFLPCLDGIAQVMEAQIMGAIAKSCRVEKVLLIGGFAGSKCLVAHLKHRLNEINAKFNCHIELIKADNCPTAVASGAVLRAFNKENGPSRFARSSYGILRAEPFGDHAEHKVYKKPPRDRHDGVFYVKRTVDWVLKLGNEVPPRWECKPFICTHTIGCFPVRPLICQEILYVSDTATESHYRLTDPRNKDAEKVGSIEVDFTFLRDEGRISPTEPGLDESGRRRVGSRHYKIHYTMVIMVIDRDLRCFAVYEGRVVKKCRINIASGFSPGVK